MPRPHRNNVLMLNLTAFSLMCLLVLVGGYFYSGGSLLPSTKGSDAGEAIQIWIMWGVVVTVPLVTAVLWVLRLTARSGS